MKPPAFKYVAPDTVDEVLEVLAAYGDECKVLAGGQSLGPLLNLRLSSPAVLVDIARVHELADPPAPQGSRLTIGAMTRQSVLEKSDLVASHCSLLARAVPFVAHTAIRNRGTLGGSMAHADAAAEIPAVAVAMDAECTVRGARGDRVLPAQDFFQGHFATAMSPEELLVQVAFPMLPSGAGTSWVEFAPRHGDYAIVGVAVTVTLGADGAVGRCAIAYSGVADRPIRSADAEAAMCGQEPRDALFREAAALAGSQCDPPGDLVGSAAYRRNLVTVLTREAMRSACAEATVAAA